MLYFMTLGFICGLLIPITASRFGKILPADPGTIFCSLLHRPHLPIAITDFHHRKLIQKWRKMFYFSLFWAVFLALCFGGAFALIGFEYILWFNLFGCGGSTILFIAGLFYHSVIDVGIWVCRFYRPDFTG